MAKAKQLPSGNWRVRATFTDADGIQHSESFTEPTAKRAEAKAAMWQAGMLEKKKNRPKQELGAAMDEYIETCRCAGLSPATIRAYVSARNNAYNMLIRRNIDHITLRDVQAWINIRSKISTPKTIKNNLSLMLSVLKSCGIKLDSDMLKLPKQTRDEIDIPSDAQVSMLLTATYDDDDMYISIALAALMGLRRSEICALSWNDITMSDDHPYLDVSKALVLDEDALLVEKTPKTAAGYRFLPIPEALYIELKRRRNLRSRIITITPNALTARYAKLTKKLGLPSRFHALRHYHASVMLREGVQQKYIVSDMGHSSFDMVMRVYGHIMQEKRGTIAAVMDAHATSIIGVATKTATKSKNF